MVRRTDLTNAANLSLLSITYFATATVLIHASALPQSCVISTISYSWWGLINTYTLLGLAMHVFMAGV